jgi:hypothetical protein
MMMEGMSNGDSRNSAIVAMRISVRRFINLYITIVDRCWLFVVRFQVETAFAFDQRATINEQRFLKNFFYLFANSF